MPNTPTFAHIGAPKAASKSLQKHLFRAHPQLAHLGMGIDGRVGWATPELQRRIEADLRCTKPLLYDPAPVAAAWSAAAADATGPDTRRCGLSYENLSITLPLDVDVTEKARRLRLLLGENCRVLFVLREQRSQLQSAYAELLLNGLAVDFQTCIDDLLRTHVRSWISDLCYGAQLAAWRREFGDDHVLVTFVEELEAQPEAELVRIQGFLGVTPTVRSLPRENEGMSAAQLSILLRLNRHMQHDLSATHGSLFQADRLASHLDATWPELPAVPRLINATLGRAAAQAARTSTGLAGLPPLERCYRPDQEAMLQRLYGDDNGRLAEQIGRPLPRGYMLPTPQ